MKKIKTTSLPSFLLPENHLVLTYHIEDSLVEDEPDKIELLFKKVKHLENGDYCLIDTKFNLNQVMPCSVMTGDLNFDLKESEILWFLGLFLSSNPVFLDKQGHIIISVPHHHKGRYRFITTSVTKYFKCHMKVEEFINPFSSLFVFHSQELQDYLYKEFSYDEEAKEYLIPPFLFSMPQQYISIFFEAFIGSTSFGLDEYLSKSKLNILSIVALKAKLGIFGSLIEKKGSFSFRSSALSKTSVKRRFYGDYILDKVTKVEKLQESEQSFNNNEAAELALLNELLTISENEKED
jgi:hypothetical protein